MDNEVIANVLLGNLAEETLEKLISDGGTYDARWKNSGLGCGVH